MYYLSKIILVERGMLHENTSLFINSWGKHFLVTGLKGIVTFASIPCNKCVTLSQTYCTDFQLSEPVGVGVIFSRIFQVFCLRPLKNASEAAGKEYNIILFAAGLAIERQQFIQCAKHYARLSGTSRDA